MWQTSTMGFYLDLTEGMKACIGEGKKFSTNADLARYCGVQAVQTSRYINGEREKHLKALGNILDKIGAKLVWDHDSHAEGAAENTLMLVHRIQELEKEVERLKEYKIKWEGHLELVRAQSGVPDIPSNKKIA